MKKLYLSLLTVASLITLRANAQDDGIDKLLKTAPGDATKLINAYADPLFKGFGTALNSGWANTAKTHKLLHFELRVSASGTFTPTNQRSFNVTQIGLSSNIRPVAGSPNTSPTFGGDKNATPATLGIYGTQAGVETEVDRIKLPEAVSSIVPGPQIQLTVGLVHNTDLIIRTTPKIKIGSDFGQIGMVGFGLKHDFGADFGRLMPFNLAVLAGYNRINYEKSLSVTPSAGKAPDAASVGKTDFSTQRVEGHFSGFNAQVIISKKLLFFTPFAAVGYNTAKIDLGLYGNYPVTNGLATYTVYTNPVTINRNTLSNMKVDAGFQLDLAILKIYASASLAEYKSVNAGIGFGF